MKLNPVPYILPAIWVCLFLAQVGDIVPAKPEYKKTYDAPLLLGLILFTTAAVAFHAGKGDIE